MNVKFSAGVRRPDHHKPSFTLDETSTKLSTRAVQVDIVHAMSEAYDNLSIDLPFYHTLWLLEAESLAYRFAADPSTLPRTLIADRGGGVDDPLGLGQDLPGAYCTFRRHFPLLPRIKDPPLARLTSTLDPGAQAAEEALAEEVRIAVSYAWQFKASCSGRRLGVTACGRLALVPATAEAGDVVVVIPGLQVPYVLRECKGVSRQYQLVGECYLDGAMRGEVDLGGAERIVLV